MEDFDFGYFGDESFVDPENYALDVSIAYMGDPSNINSEREAEEAFWAEFERGWEQAEIEADEREWYD